jgi:hypothetical protein
MPSYVEILTCLELSDEAARSVHAYREGSKEYTLARAA